MKTRLRLQRRVFSSNFPWQPRCPFREWRKWAGSFAPHSFEWFALNRLRRNVPIKVSGNIGKTLGQYLI